ncbi:Aspartyl protease [Saccharicrinis carchari]|uniref:Aspartyl protease n=1 Tax=Saccharicrinis carchari TaxID=1168039 RepID=A0A521ABR4_SACCC|nr:retropepsin-like aspartic protease [Saccharicrinis carchari]SMO32254.1 Aspartyl protease [Saccharicrinis carchari]
MRNKFIILLLTGCLIFITWGCSLKWTQAIRYGEVSRDEFRETVNIEIQNGLVFLPVTIRGKQYRFLFDTGAPFSISKQLQHEHAFEIISKGNIIDSDHNKKKVDWAQVDSIHVGNVSFMNQTAFVGDFNANPLLKCLEIDGIIGSNLIRHANWTIDQEQKTVSLNSTINKDAFQDCIIIPFKTDYQYNIFIDVHIGPATVKNVLMDYGSNGSISLNNEIFTTLKGRNIIGAVLLEKGVQQAGIIGKPVNFDRKITYNDSVGIGRLGLNNIMLRTGKTVSLGNKLLSRFPVTIDWDKQNLYFRQNDTSEESNRFPRFSLGYSTEKGIYVQSVIKNSNAWVKGVRPNCIIERIDSLDFENGNDFCDYAKHELGDNIFVQLIDTTGQRQELNIRQTPIIK